MKTPSSQLSTEQLISAVSRLNLPELEQVFDHVLALQGGAQGSAFVGSRIGVARP